MLRDGHASPSASPTGWTVELSLSGAVRVWVLSCGFTPYHCFLDLDLDLSVCSDFFSQCSCSTLSFGSLPCALSLRESLSFPVCISPSGVLVLSLTCLIMGIRRWDSLLRQD